MRTIIIICLLALFLLGCDSTTRTYLLKTSGSNSGGSDEYSNLYIIHDSGEQSDYNISGSLQDPYEVHIE